ncbi:ATP-binding protein [Halopolyspora algeriensis]|uniref:ATP-binding protein n=1 Tax=Halopolyspora algeriensis TaxID=1500506 RepID=UPI001FEA25D8|nr:ATP-binding protein [Halopolyspora algeriensis]
MRPLQNSETLPESARLRRQRSGRLVAGVATGTAEHLDVPVLWVRAVFAALAAFGGAGILAYGLLWVFVPQQAGAEHPPSPRERQQGFGLLVLGLGLAVTVVSFGALPPWLAGPLAVTLIGAAVVWREADESQRRRWRRNARSGVAGAMLGGGGRFAAVRILAGVCLVVAGIVVFLVSNVSVSALQFALLAVLATLVGAAVLTVPWWVRLVRDLNVERASRIRSQERAEIAAHLHDSVLQTLALIQKQSDSSRQVRRLARGQERELRHWLYGSGGYRAAESGKAEPARAGRGETAAGQGEVGGSPVASRAVTLSDELARICADVEDTFAITVQPVVVGDCALDESGTATLAAAREAVVNAAKHAGVDEVSVYAEVQQECVEVFVRDRGVGFDPDDVPADRHGLADSVRGRMERNGGHTRLRTAAGAGTEVQLRMPRSGR